MRVTLLSGSGALGGAERSLLDQAMSVRRARPSWSLSLLAPTSGPLVESAAALGIEARVVPLGEALSNLGESHAGTAAGRAGLAVQAASVTLPLLSYVRRLRRAIGSLAPDIVHTHGIKAHLLGAWANPARAAVVWHLHDYVGRRAATGLLLRRSLRRCRGIVAVSESVAADVRVTLGQGIPIATVPNGVDLDRYQPEGPCLDLDALAGLPRPATPILRVGLLATFSRWKGHATFLEAFARLDDPSVRAYVIGGPVYQTAHSQVDLTDLEAQVARLGLTGRVGFTGFVSHPDEALRALDIVVHASTDPEPFGLVIAEAMACGRALIVSDAGGAHELFTPAVDALGHTPGDAESLAVRLRELIRDPHQRAALGRAAVDTARRRFDRWRLADELVPVYERALLRSHA